MALVVWGSAGRGEQVLLERRPNVLQVPAETLLWVAMMWMSV